MTNLILREFNGNQIRQRDDGYICLTDMAKATNKDYYEWSRLPSTFEIISVISRNTGIIPELLITSKARLGTYAHRKVALAFATYCSPEFFYVVLDWTEEIMTKGGYISPNANLEQLQTLVSDIQREYQQKFNAIQEEYEQRFNKINQQLADVAGNTITIDVELDSDEVLEHFHQTVLKICSRLNTNSVRMTEFTGNAILKNRRIREFCKVGDKPRILKKELVYLFKHLEKKGYGKLDSKGVFTVAS